MAKAVFDNYIDEIQFQRNVWERKPALQKLYRHWYRSIVASLSPERPVIEIGSGSGNFKQFFPDAIATDVMRGGPWIERILDAENLQLDAGEAGNLVVFDVIHHLQRPLDFLRRASAALKPGGRLLLCEPALTLWSSFVYRTFHHEGIDPDWDLFALDGKPPEADPGHTFANEAIAEILFWKQRARTLELLEDLRLVEARKFGFLIYPLTGGFGYRSFVPSAGLEFLLKLEDALTRPIANRVTGMRMLVIFEKKLP